MAVEKGIRARIEQEGFQAAKWLAAAREGCYQVIAVAGQEALREISEEIGKVEQYEQLLRGLPHGRLERYVKNHLVRIEHRNILGVRDKEALVSGGGGGNILKSTTTLVRPRAISRKRRNGSK